MWLRIEDLIWETLLNCLKNEPSEEAARKSLL